MDNNFQIDPDAKCRVELNKIPRDANGKPYYIGKLQWPGTLDFEEGASFMVFVSDNGCEEIQIAPLDPLRRSKSRREGSGMNNGRFSIDLHPMQDRDGNVYYVGEALGPVSMKLRNGIFFTIFVSREGYEELQISRLVHKNKGIGYTKSDVDSTSDNYNRRQYRRTWASEPQSDDDTVV